MTFSTQSKKPQLSSFKTSKANSLLVTRYELCNFFIFAIVNTFVKSFKITVLYLLVNGREKKRQKHINQAGFVCTQLLNELS